MKDFSLASNKMAARRKVLATFNLKKVVGLAGPNFKEYIQLFNSLGYSSIECWEFSREIMLHQMSQMREIKNINFSLTYGDILQAPNHIDDTLYDLDFCDTIAHFRDHVKKFSHNFIFTFALRPFGIYSTFDTFAQCRREIVEEIDRTNATLRTDKGIYNYIIYTDKIKDGRGGGAPMIMIYSQTNKIQ